MERTPKKKTRERLKLFGVKLENIQKFISNPEGAARAIGEVREGLQMRGMGDFVEFDLTVVRGLAYYTGLVFEVFDKRKKERAIAGGGRYNKLLKLLSDGKVDMAALGFGMGDVMLGNLIDDTPTAKAKMDEWVAAKHAADIFVVIAMEEWRGDALGLVQQLRQRGLRVDFPLVPAKVGKQFQAAE